jgi:bacillithiol system protein YtxJ
MNWEILKSEQQFLDLLQSDIIFAVFKHSTRCSISSMVKSRVERSWDLDFPIYYLDLIQYRGVSNLIADKSGIEHESPQMIVFKNGKVLYSASHTGIDVSEMKV